MEPVMPASEDIDALVAFLPLLYGERAAPSLPWRGGEAVDGAITTPWPEYAPVVAAFFHLAGSPCWSDYAYRPEDARTMLADKAFVQQAGLADIKTMLTFCVRGERFVSGFWGQMIMEEKIRLLLERLVEIRSESS